MDRLDDTQIATIYEQAGSVITGSHFVYSKPEGCGNHGPNYINKDALFPISATVRHLAFETSHRIKELGILDQVEVIVGPESGGAKFSMWLSYEMTNRVREIGGHRQINFAAADKVGRGEFVIKRGYEKYVDGKRAFCGEDILNSGESGLGAIGAIRDTGGNPLGLAALANRGGVTSEFLGVQHLISLMDVEFESWPEEECPLCKADEVKIRTDLGHGAEFLSRKVK